MIVRHLQSNRPHVRQAFKRRLLDQERRLATLPERIRLGRTLAALGLAAVAVGLLTLPFVEVPADARVPWAVLLVTSIAAVGLAALSPSLMEAIPSWVMTGAAIGDQTVYVLVTGDTESPFLPGFTAIVLVTAASTSTRLTMLTVGLAAGGLSTVALADAVLSSTEIVRLLAESVVLMIVAQAVSRLAWRRRIDLRRAGHRLDRIRTTAQRERLASQLDPVTGLRNRRAFEAELSALAASGGLVDIALVVADADRLKAVNDRHGHPAGDQALRALARELARTLRARERVYRIGGDEFAAIVDKHDAPGLARRLDGSIGAELAGIGRVTASIGVVASDDGVSATELIALADGQMYGAKRAARGELVEPPDVAHREVREASAE